MNWTQTFKAIDTDIAAAVTASARLRAEVADLLEAQTGMTKVKCPVRGEGGGLVSRPVAWLVDWEPGSPGEWH